ncbi:hypothetical protein MTO96_042250 [Rhipicephalus appendiculatus]
MGSRPPAFDDAVSSWSTYRVRLEAYFEGNEITDAAKRRALLVSSLSDSVVRILQGHQPGVPINYLTSGTFAVDGTECDSEEEMMYALVAHSSANKRLVQPIERTLTWEGRRLRMIVDTGSPVSVIPKSLYKKHRKWWPALQKTPLRLSCFLGPLPVVGKVDMKVQLGPVTVSSSLIVVDHRGPLLCGGDTIEEFRKAGIFLLEGGTSSSVNVIHADSQLTALLDDFSDRFENLGCCKGPPVKLYLKEGAQPRFLKARSMRRGEGWRHVLSACSSVREPDNSRYITSSPLI